MTNMDTVTNFTASWSQSLFALTTHERNHHNRLAWYILLLNWTGYK